VTVGGAQCPDWMIYHTDVTGDWEIFRLGELPDGIEADPNLSRGVGERIFDVMPGMSADRRWIAFSSNRDGNWEVYLSAVDDEVIQRVTFNTFAVDIDPVWSPVGSQIAYGSNRDGNWELYLFDAETGQETRLTQTTGNEVNPSWSPDGTRLLYQTDASGIWQVAELTVATGAVTLLSDGTGDDHDPLYSNDGSAVVFRSYRDGDASVIYTMNADGTGVTRISETTADALYAVWSPDDSLIAYQSDLDGDSDVYLYDVAAKANRLFTDNAIEDYAPTWICDANELVFTSEVTGDPNLFEHPAIPEGADPIVVEDEAAQLTTEDSNDRYPVSSPPEEKSSRESSLPSPVINQ
jgi:Tol biopolymer transport system component